MKEKREGCEVLEKGLGWLSLGCLQREKAVVERIMGVEDQGRRRRRGQLSTATRSMGTGTQ